jgi:hypothetical protein
LDSEGAGHEDLDGKWKEEEWLGICSIDVCPEVMGEILTEISSERGNQSLLDEERLGVLLGEGWEIGRLNIPAYASV